MAQTITLTWLINGETHKVRATTGGKLINAAKRALKQGGHLSRPATDWQVRDANGVLLETNRKISDFQFATGTRLFLSLAVGAGGNQPVPIKTAILVDPMGHGFGEFTPEDEIRDHTEYYQSVLERPLKVHTPSCPEQIEEGTDLVLYDYGGMGVGNSMTERNAQKIITWAEEHPNSLVVVVSTFTYSNFVRYELEERGLLQIPNITCAHNIESWDSSKRQAFPEDGIPEWWKAGLK